MVAAASLLFAGLVSTPAVSAPAESDTVVVYGAPVATTTQPCSKFCDGWATGGSADGYGVILHTADGGVTWQRQGEAGEIPDVNLQGVSAANHETAWVVGQQTILRTRDGGKTWREEMLPSGLPADFGLLQVKAIGRRRAFAVGTPSVLLKTTPFTRAGPGPQWVRMPVGPHLPPIFFGDVDAVGPNDVWAVGGVISGSNNPSGLAIAHYGGRVWRPQLLTSSSGDVCSHLIGLSVLDDRTAWAVGGFDCPPYRTLDGVHWAPVGGPVIPGHFDTNRVVAVSDTLIWIAHDNAIVRSVDGGATWEQTPGCSGGHYCYGISAAGNRFAWATSLGVAPGDLYRWVHNHWESQAVPAMSSAVIVSMVGARR